MQPGRNLPTFPDVAVPFRATLILVSTANVTEAGV